MRMHPMVPELVPAGVLNLMPKLHILPRRPAAPTQNQNSSCPLQRICNPSWIAFKTVVCLLGVPLIGVFQQPTARILSMFCIELWTQKKSFLPLSAIGSLIGSDRPNAVIRTKPQSAMSIRSKVSTKPGATHSLDSCQGKTFSDSQMAMYLDELRNVVLRKGTPQILRHPRCIQSITRSSRAVPAL